MDLKSLCSDIHKMSTITCNTRDHSFDSLFDAVIYCKEILYNNNVYLRIETLVFHDLVRGAVFPGRMVILRYCIATDLFSGSRVFENYPNAFLSALTSQNFNAVT